MEDIYEPINKTLQHIGALMDAAEAHGILCGLLCMSEPDENEWIKHVLRQTTLKEDLAAKCQRQLALVKQYTLGQLNAMNDEFMPLLPSDELPLSERVEALGGWCEGFLFGLGLTEFETEALPEESTEFIDDIISVSQITLVEDNEETEEDYMQVIEYIKVGVITLYEEMRRLETEDGQD
jgi:hypothetical protein